MLSESDLTSLVKDKLVPEWRHECTRLDRIDRWYRWSPDQVRLPRSATPELRQLADLSRVPWLGLVVTSTAQCMYVDGYRSALDPVGEPSGPDKDSGPWRIWLANGMDQRQIAIHRAMLAYGYSFATCLPGEDWRGELMPVMRGQSPRNMYAWYENPAEDDWPEYAIRKLSYKDESPERFEVFDDEAVYTVVVRGAVLREGEKPVALESIAEHGAGVTPVVRYCHALDLDGRTPGEVEPYIPLAARINQTSYDRLLTQKFNSWKVRYITGMAEPDVEEDAIRKKLQLRQDDLLVAEDPDTKFGALDETQLSGFIAAHEADVEALAAVSQTPTHELTGKLINVSAEGLAMIRASQQQKVYETQKNAGRAHAQLLRLAAHLDGDEGHARDVSGRVTWQDTSIRSMAQAMDAWGKAVALLGVPASMTWGRLPGVEKSDVEEWKAQAREEDPIDRMQRELDRQSAPASDRAPAEG